MRRILLPLIVAVATVSCCVQPQTEGDEIISLYFDDQLLIEAREAIAAQDPAIMDRYNALKAKTDNEYLNMKSLSIVDDKIHFAPSRDPRDYISLSPYWWADPTKEGGVPYIRDDGNRNPEVYEYHERERSTLFGEAVQSLAVVYFFTGEERYAQKCAELIRTWFLDPERGMNPNMTYAQYVPGMTYIRGTGIIDSRRFLTGLNAAQIIQNSEAWSAKDERELKRWASVFAYWLECSVNGLKEYKSQNNHGLWYEVMRQISTMYTGDYDYLRELITEHQLPRIDNQVAEDGSLPHELARTLGLHYTTFALEALNLSNIMGQKVGVDVWGYEGENGRSPKMAIDYVMPYYDKPESWRHQQIKPFGVGRGAVILYQAGKSLNDQRYSEMAQELARREAKGRERDGSINSVLYYKLGL